MKTITYWVAAAILIYTMLLAVATIGSGFSWLSGGREGAKSLFSFATNPMTGLLVGMLSTALLQSSSTVSSIIVGLVAGGLPVSLAIPMVMGANIGTTVTNTIVSLAHASRGEEFRRAFSTATVHDFFNLIAVIIFLPLELLTGFLERSSQFLVERVIGVTNGFQPGGFDFLAVVIKPVVTAMQKNIELLSGTYGSLLMILMGIAMIFLAISFLGRILRAVLIGRAQLILKSAIGHGPMAGIASGTAITFLVQSSSTTTSLAVPLAGSGVMTTKELYPFTVGANIGTCITALMAALAVTGPMAGYAIQIALVHLLFNVLAVALIFGLPALRSLPLNMSEWMAKTAGEHHSFAIIYLILIFFILPGTVLGMSSFW